MPAAALYSSLDKFVLQLLHTLSSDQLLLTGGGRFQAQFLYFFKQSPWQQP